MAGQSPGQRPLWATQGGIVYAGPFRNNIEAFLGHFGVPISLTAPSVKGWVVGVKLKEDANEPFQLYIYEETAEDSRPPVCDHCRIAGWQQQPVSTKRYHFIVPLAPSTAPFVGGSKKSEAAADRSTEGGELPYVAPASVFDSHGHLLHGTLHMNGFGHLLRINGLEGGSTCLTGRQIMNVWDRLCTVLRARKVSVEDVSNKAGMDLRVLFAAAYRLTWYGRWDYGFGRGPFNISKKTWKSTVDSVHSMAIADILSDFLSFTGDQVIPQIVERYQVSIPGVDASPTSLGGFLQRMLFLVSNAEAAASVLGVPQFATRSAAKPQTVANPPASVPNCAEELSNNVLADGVKAGKQERQFSKVNSRKRSRAAMEVQVGGPNAVVEAKPNLATARANHKEHDGDAEHQPAAAAHKEQGQEEGPSTQAAKANGGAGVLQQHDHPDPKESNPAKRQKKDMKAMQKTRAVAALPVVHVDLKPLDTSKAPARFPVEMIQLAVERVLKLLKANEGFWIRRTMLKAAVLKQVKDNALVDACIKLLADVTFNGSAIYRQLDMSNNVFFYMLEPADLKDRLHPVVHEHKLKLPGEDATADLQDVMICLDQRACQRTANASTDLPCGVGPMPIAAELYPGKGEQGRAEEDTALLQGASEAQEDASEAQEAGITLQDTETPMNEPLVAEENQDAFASQQQANCADSGAHTSMSCLGTINRPTPDLKSTARQQPVRQSAAIGPSATTQGGKAGVSQPCVVHSAHVSGNSGGIIMASVELPGSAPQTQQSQPELPSSLIVDKQMQPALERETAHDNMDLKAEATTAGLHNTVDVGPDAAMAKEEEDPIQPTIAHAVDVTEHDKEQAAGLIASSGARAGKARQTAIAEEPREAGSRSRGEGRLDCNVLATPDSLEVACNGQSQADIVEQSLTASNQPCNSSSGRDEGLDVLTDGLAEQPSKRSSQRIRLSRQEDSNGNAPEQLHTHLKNGGVGNLSPHLVALVKRQHGRKAPHAETKLALPLLPGKQSASERPTAPDPLPILGTPVKGKRTYKGRPAASYLPAHVVCTSEAAERPMPKAVSFGKLSHIDSPAGFWGTRGQRSARCGSSPGQSGCASAWKSFCASAISENDLLAAKLEAKPMGNSSSALTGRPIKPSDAELPAEHQATDVPASRPALEASSFKDTVMQETLDKVGNAEQAEASNAFAVCPSTSDAQHITSTPYQPAPHHGQDQAHHPADVSGPTPECRADQLQAAGSMVAADVGSPNLAATLLAKKSANPSKSKRGRLKGGKTSSKKKRRLNEVSIPSSDALPRSNLGAPAKQTWQLLRPGGIFRYQDGLSPRDQVLCDLVYFFDCVMRCYHPAIVTNAVPAALRPAPGSISVKSPGRTGRLSHVPLVSSRKSGLHLKAARILEQVAVLRDTKHFVKDYQGTTLSPGAIRPLGGSVRLLCQMEPLDFVSAEHPTTTAGPGKPGKSSSSTKPRMKVAKRRRIVHPPVELLQLTARSTVRQVQAAAQDAFRQVYKMFEAFKVNRIEGLPTSKASGRIGKTQDSTVVKIVAVNASPDPRWHHAGGEEDWVVTCSCGCRDDDGERMIACDSCGLWMHLRCQGIPDSALIPEEFVCTRCINKPVMKG